MLISKFSLSKLFFKKQQVNFCGNISVWCICIVALTIAAISENIGWAIFVSLVFFAPQVGLFFLSFSEKVLISSFGTFLFPLIVPNISNFSKV